MSTPYKAIEGGGQVAMGRTAATPPIFVDRERALQELLTAARQAPTIGVDTESNSLYAYYHQVCLIQISLPGADYVIDPLTVDVKPLGTLFADPACEKIFHAAENDILGLKRDHQFTFANLFDTMLAARIMGWAQAGLAGILATKFGVTLDKSLQRANWGHRPLEPDLLAYAKLDTHYLLPLRALQEQALKECGRWEEAKEAFERISTVEWVDKPFDPNGFWSIAGARDLSSQELTVLQALYLFREDQAQRENRPPFKVLDQHSLVALSRAQPATSNDLGRVRGMTTHQVRRYGAGLLDAVKRGRSAPPPAPPRRPDSNGRPDPRTVERYDALRAWRSDRARQRGVDSDVIFTNDQLMAIARQAPKNVNALQTLGIMGPWKLGEYGEAIIQALA